MGERTHDPGQARRSPGRDDAAFEAIAAAFDNPDHVAIVIHNHRWRRGLASGEPSYDELERRLAPGPTMKVPTITLEGDANGAPHPDAAAFAPAIMDVDQ